VRLERTTSGSGGQRDSNLRNCKTKTYKTAENHFATCLAKIVQKYPELKQIIEAWPELSTHIKAAIKALVQTHKMEKE